MIKIARILAIAAAMALPSISAAATYFEDAPVVRVTPIFERSCTPSYTSPAYQEQAPRSRTAPVLGAIVGGALGNQVGDGRGRDAATVAGAVLGYNLTRDVQEQNRYNERLRHSGTRSSYCEERVREYIVQFRTAYGLEEVTLPYHPGRTVRLRIEIFVEASNHY